MSESKRFLAAGDGKPFFWLGDTAWELFHRLNREEAQRYLRNRAERRFTVIQAVALAELDGLNDPNPYGHLPLIENDPTRPDVKDARAGGLAENVAGLAAALVAAGHDVRCALPHYGGIEDRFPPRAKVEPGCEAGLFVAGRWTRVRLAILRAPALPCPVVLVGHDVFAPHGIYVDEATGQPFAAEALRWKVFCRALHETLGRDGWVPDLVHGHDHQTGLLMGLLRWRASAHRPARVFTLHQLEYQGIAERSWIADSGLPNDLYYPMGPLEFHGRVNPMKLGIESANRVTTVSPTYAREIRESEAIGEGLQQLYLRQPGYGSSYVTGKALIDELIRVRARQLGESFTLRGFFDDVNGAGMMPVSLIRWQLTGDRWQPGTGGAEPARMSPGREASRVTVRAGRW